MTDLKNQILGKSNYLWLLDAGHGGMVNGVYTTAPAKMHKFHDGMTIYEGVINRSIVDLIALKMETYKIDFQYIHDPVEDTPLPIRVMRADASFHKDNRAIYLSVHSNSGGGSGFEIFTSKGQTKSDIVAKVFCAEYMVRFPNEPFRKDLSDGDYDKESDFYVLRKTDCPALLVENLFFDNRVEAQYLLSKDGQNSIANCIVSAMLTCEGVKPI